MRWIKNNNYAAISAIQQQSGDSTPLRYQSRGVDAAGVYTSVINRRRAHTLHSVRVHRVASLVDSLPDTPQGSRVGLQYLRLLILPPGYHRESMRAVRGREGYRRAVWTIMLLALIGSHYCPHVLPFKNKSRLPGPHYNLLDRGAMQACA